MTPAQRGSCRACGAKLVDWGRVHRRDLSDAEHTFEALKHEYIRHHFFHTEIDNVALLHARRKGRVKLRDAVRDRLRTSIGRAEPFRDGTQTPKDGNSIFYAQHATATCCRTCLEYWHGIPKGRKLTDEELDYCAELVDLYLDERLPDLDDMPEKIPPRRKASPRTPRLL
ncbi:MAG: DUF4186 family protein [Xanthomonadaceae bacterium]|nr:DUF4186 family protein [Xanthomonadaceae bacterium]